MPSGKRFFDELIDYWKAMPKADGPLPLKTSFSPMSIYKMLPYLFFNERLDKYNVRVRLMGEALEERARGTMPNRNIFDTIAKCQWDIVEEFNNSFSKHPCGGHMFRTTTFGVGLVYDVETLGLPLLSVEGEPRFTVGLANFRKNPVRSLEAQEKNVTVNEVRNLEFVDLGYGVPDTQEIDTAKQLSSAG
jgi:hypothetical protein